jgi:uncharacterized protein YprB with RNaseH-like and TPR domain
MFDDSLRRRLEALNRGPLPPGSATSAVVPRATRGRAAFNNSPALSDLAIRPLPGLLRSGESVETAVGGHWRVRLPLGALWKEGTSLVAARQEHLQTQLAASRQSIEPIVLIDAEFASLVSALPNRAIVLDLDTCGLAGASLFLIGLLRQIDGVVTVELLLARDFSEEAAVLESFWQIHADHDVLVTFNGKSFDWPMVLDRTIRHRLRPAGRQPNMAGGDNATTIHLDVLHHARRRWRKQLPDCRLQTLERHICRRRRPTDIPGHAIPAVYAEYVRTGFERDMDIVLYHNALDLVTLFDLALRLAA